MQLVPVDRSDGRLKASEIASVRLHADLAALWACDSGSGQSSGGDGLLGLAWAFQAAGCKSVIASQWEVQDGATAMMMAATYKALNRTDGNGRRLRKDEALREAILALRKVYSSPYYWAAFQIYGDTSSLQ